VTDSLTQLQSRRWVAALVAAGALTIGILVVMRWSPGRTKSTNPLVTTPCLVLGELSAKSIFYNGPARPWLLAQRSDLLANDDRAAGSERARSFAQAALSVPLFRQLDRRYRFDTLLLVGDPTGYRTLLDHLVEAKDFTLSYADHTSLVFSRSAAAPWSLRALEPLRAKLAGVPQGEMAEVLAQAASKLVAAHREAEAKTLLEEARKLDGKSPEVWNGLAIYWTARGEFREALTAADRALNSDRQHLGALSTRTQILYATKRYNEALTLSQQLVDRMPEDPNVLFKHAQVAHEAHAYQREIAALEKLIALAEAERRSTTGYRLYLAQSYMAASKGQSAIDAFTRVLADPELPEDQRKFAQESLERIKNRTGL
jgi:tetratricopeptide (TPR) repeat protein